MHFKKLEISGFKSFMNRTKFNFEPGVTAIVGPNGCGKSNVVDAIKWVLGEQSAKSIRGGSMQDVIFNGTDKQEPVNMAEVSLTFTNEDRVFPVDYDEVTISRRLFRSGESEYLLNKTPVRLMDVRNMLMGTGIGTSSYSIVEQGNMDMILSSKPEDRRYIFEEASGITCYKSKKREAMLKLGRTQDNLTRLGDIITEVGRQIGSIERQARKAERYKVRYEELKDLDVKFSYKRFKSISADDDKLQNENMGLKQKAEAIKEDAEASSDSLIKHREEHGKLVDELQSLRHEEVSISSGIDKNSHTIDVNRERALELEKQIERLGWEVEKTAERKDALKERVEKMETSYSEVRNRREEKDGELSTTVDDLNGMNEKLEVNRHELKCNRDRTLDMATEQTRSKNMLIKMNADITNTRSREKRLEFERQNVTIEKDGASEDLKTVETAAENAERELEQKRNEFKIFNDEITAYRQKLSEHNNEKHARDKRLNEIRPRREFLEKLVNEREGISNSVRDIMKKVDEGDNYFSGVKGVLSELVNIEENFEESMASVLGDLSQALVVDTRDIAKKVVEHLSGNSMESVNFIILDELENSEGHLMVPEGAEGDLKDLTSIIVADEPYVSALLEMMSGTFVAGKEEAAAAFVAENSDFSGCVVSGQGELFQKGLWRSKNFSGRETVPLFGRREKIEKLLNEENIISIEIGDIESKITELEERLKESMRLKEGLETELRKKQMDFADISSKRAVIRDKVRSFGQELTLLDSEIDEEVSSLRMMLEAKEDVEQKLQELDVKNVELQRAIEDSQTFIQESSQKREKTLYVISDLRAELSSMKKEEENLADNLHREKELYTRADDETEDKTNRIFESKERITAFDAEVKELEERNTEHNSVIEVMKTEISEKSERKDNLTEIIRDEEEKLRAKENELESLRNRNRDTDIRKKELEYKRQALSEKIMDTYKVDISRLEMDIDEDTDWESVETRICELKEKLSKMGEVSHGAVEEHKQLAERFQFLSTQRDDLTHSKEMLMQAINKINRTTRKMFMETFEKVQKEFNNYFRMLFNGGKAELVLLDESDVLECGIDIIVRPPGKKLHNIMQLSGGEKAMAAVALIFAIFKVNPSPFCVLDEIDAPLDESNVVRFCSVLKEFLELSQFIIITHNRMTIQLADILYGITMEEKGVSKVVSVKFSEDKEVKENEAVPVSV